MPYILTIPAPSPEHLGENILLDEGSGYYLPTVHLDCTNDGGLTRYAQTDWQIAGYDEALAYQDYENEDYNRYDTDIFEDHQRAAVDNPEARLFIITHVHTVTVNGTPITDYANCT